MTAKTKRRMPWRKVGHDLWTDEAGYGLSGLAIALRVMFEARSTGDDTQLVNGKAMPQVGWMLRESGAPLTVAKIALLARFPEQDVIAALAELEAEEIIVSTAAAGLLALAPKAAATFETALATARELWQGRRTRLPRGGRW